ncbi:F-box protein, partial [Trifolium pratense]
QQQQTLSLPWLIRIGPNVNGKTHLWNPLDLHQNLPIDFRYNVLDFNQLSIVELRHVFVLYVPESGDSLQNDPYPDLNLDESRVLPLFDYPDYFNLLEASGVDHEMLHW